MTSRDITVRPALHRDISVLTGMARALADSIGRPPEGVDKDALAALLFGSDRWSEAFIAVDRDHRALGYVTLSRAFEPHSGARTLWLGDFYVMASARERGVGRLLLRAAAKRAAALKCRALVTEVGRGDAAGQDFFDKVPGGRYEDVRRWRLEDEALAELAEG